MWNTPTKEELANIPRLYETENIPLKDKIIHMHFFIGGCDWFIAEYDGEDLFWVMPSLTVTRKMLSGVTYHSTN
jgi:hypothetical protein